MVSLDPKRPLIICDADEVLVQFVAGFERFLERQDLYLDLTTFALHGNVKHRSTNEPVDNREVSRLLDAFFASDTGILDVVPGAADALAALSGHAQIVILSNLPDHARAARVDHLRANGMPYPVIAGSGPKGVVVKRIIDGFDERVVFVDDLPPHLTSVATQTPHVHRLHFIADPRLAKLLPPAQDAHRRIDDWPTAHAWIASVLDGS
jgi:hypothetical protein